MQTLSKMKGFYLKQILDQFNGTFQIKIEEYHYNVNDSNTAIKVSEI